MCGGAGPGGGEGGFGGLGIGNPGSYGGGQTVGSPGGTGGANIGQNVSDQGQRNFMNTVLNMIPPTALVQGLMYAGTGQGFGDIAQGDPSGTGPTGGPGGVVSPGSTTSRAITRAIAQPAAAPLTVTPLADDTKRKRVGRQETILTSRSALSDAPTFRPTLLGQ